MADRIKLRYEIDLAALPSGAAPAALATRAIEPSDRDTLAQLMLDAYRGTIDYEGETLVEALGEVDGWLAESPLLNHSFTATSDDGLVSATLVMNLDNEPFIAVAMTNPSVKGRGYGTAVVDATLRSLRDAGHGRVVFYITEGNTASESLFTKLGAIRVDESLD